MRFTNLTSARPAVNVAGPRARELVERVADDPTSVSSESLPFMGAGQLSIAGVSVLALRIGYTGELSYELHYPAGYGESLWETLMDAGQDLGVVPFGMETLDILRLEKGHVIVGRDTDSPMGGDGLGHERSIQSSPRTHDRPRVDRGTAPCPRGRGLRAHR